MVVHNRDTSLSGNVLYVQLLKILGDGLVDRGIERLDVWSS
jgi:hypothetical protein